MKTENEELREIINEWVKWREGLGRFLQPADGDSSAWDRYKEEEIPKALIMSRTHGIWQNRNS